MDVSLRWSSTNRPAGEWCGELLGMISRTIDALRIEVRAPGERFTILNANVYASSEVCSILSSSSEMALPVGIIPTDISSSPIGKFDERGFVLHSNHIMHGDIRVVIDFKSASSWKTLYGNIRITE